MLLLVVNENKIFFARCNILDVHSESIDDYMLIHSQMFQLVIQIPQVSRVSNT